MVEIIFVHSLVYLLINKPAIDAAIIINGSGTLRRDKIKPEIIAIGIDSISINFFCKNNCRTNN